MQTRTRTNVTRIIRLFDARCSNVITNVSDDMCDNARGPDLTMDLFQPPLAARRSPPTAANQSLIGDNGRSLDKKRRPKPGITIYFFTMLN
jgi:hypothetical protein